MWPNFTPSGNDNLNLSQHPAPPEDQCCQKHPELAIFTTQKQRRNETILQEPHSKRGVPDKDDPISMIAQAINSLSVGERAKIYEDVHGVADQVTETPQFVQQKLFEFDLAIASIRDISRPAFDQAVAMNPSFVQGERIKFLRSENYDAVKASERMVNFFQAKLELWGEDKLGRQITYADFSGDDKAMLDSGVIQILPSRDRSGRAVTFSSVREYANSFKTYHNLLRAFWYIIMSALEDEETQRLGLIDISYFNLGTNNEIRHFQFVMPLVKLFSSCFPVNVVGNHLCYGNDNTFFKLISLAMSGIGADKRSRHKMHPGSLTESKYSLMTFGIPVNVLPVTDDGERKTANHSKWLNRRKVKEAALAKFGIFHGIDLPGRYDVLLGRGQPMQTHQGNIRFNQFVVQYREEYQATPKGKKKALADTVLVDLMKAAPCRFLRLHSNGWYYDILGTSRKDVVEKIFQTLRAASLKGKNEDSGTLQSSTSGTSSSSSKRIKSS